MEHLDADVIIVGGGTAGGSLVRELARSRPDLRILVLESGNSIIPGSSPDIETERVISDGFNWNYQYDNGFSSTRNYNTGKILGGSSAINGALAFYPDRVDWKDAGLYDHLRYDPVLDDCLVPKTEISYGDWNRLDELDALFSEWSVSNFGSRFLNAGSHRSEQEANDLFLIGRNVREQRRINSFSDFSHASSQVNIQTGVHVETVSERGKLAHVVTSNGRTYKSKKAFITAGVVGSPALLHRSGFLDVNLNSEIEKSRGFQDHPTLVVWCPMTELGINQWNGKWRQVGLNLFKGRDNGAMIGLLKGVDPHTIPRAFEAGYRQPMIGIACLLHRCNVRGHVSMGNNNYPKVSWKPGKDAYTINRFIHYLPFLLDIASSLRSKGLAEKPLLWDESFLNNRELLMRMLAGAIQPGWHGVSTLPLQKLGNDEGLEEKLRKISGASSIMVCDASIVPSMPKIPTNFLTSKLATTIAKELVHEI